MDSTERNSKSTPLHTAFIPTPTPVSAAPIGVISVRICCQLEHHTSSREGNDGKDIMIDDRDRVTSVELHPPVP